MQDEAATTMALTQDGFLGQKLSIRQPAKGFRSGHDAVMLAAAASGHGRVGELGSGAGVASLCVARRCPEAQVTGIEINADLVSLANDNAAQNDLSDRVRFVAGDIGGRFAALELETHQFDEIIANPPYYQAGSVNDLSDAGRQQAHIAETHTLDKWVSCACALVVARGHVSFIHRADALADLLAAMQPRLGALSILPIAPRQNAPANRVIVRGRRDSRAPLKILPAVYLQNPDGQPSDLAEAILRDGCALAFDTADG